jgi:hypothetical protein
MRTLGHILVGMAGIALLLALVGPGCIVNMPPREDKPEVVRPRRPGKVVPAPAPRPTPPSKARPAPPPPPSKARPAPPPPPSKARPKPPKPKRPRRGLKLPGLPPIPLP